MKCLSFDQSTRITGFAIFEDNHYIDSGIIDLHKIKDTTERTSQMGIAICNKISDVQPDCIVLENVQNQSNVDTVIKLARLQGIAIGFAAAHQIRIEIIEPSKWRSALCYKQGRAVKREELKQQSIDYVKTNFGFDFSEDRCEAICQNIAAQKILNLTPNNVWGE